MSSCSNEWQIIFKTISANPVTFDFEHVDIFRQFFFHFTSVTTVCCFNAIPVKTYFRISACVCTAALVAFWPFQQNKYVSPRLNGGRQIYRLIPHQFWTDGKLLVEVQWGWEKVIVGQQGNCSTVPSHLQYSIFNSGGGMHIFPYSALCSPKNISLWLLTTSKTSPYMTRLHVQNNTDNL